MAKTVADIMNPKLLYIREGDRPSLARAQIVKFGVTAVPVLDDDHKPVGVISLRDLSHGDEPTGPRGPAQVVRDTASVEDGARTLAELGLHHLVVVNDAGVAVGMVSAIDFIRALLGIPAAHPAAFDRY